MPDGQKRPDLSGEPKPTIDRARTRESGNIPQDSDPLGAGPDSYIRRKKSGDGFGEDGE